MPFSIQVGQADDVAALIRAADRQAKFIHTDFEGLALRVLVGQMRDRSGQAVSVALAEECHLLAIVRIQFVHRAVIRIDVNGALGNRRRAATTAASASHQGQGQAAQNHATSLNIHAPLQCVLSLHQR